MTGIVTAAALRCRPTATAGLTAGSILSRYFPFVAAGMAVYGSFAVTAVTLSD